MGFKEELKPGPEIIKGGPENTRKEGGEETMGWGTLIETREALQKDLDETRKILEGKSLQEILEIFKLENGKFYDILPGMTKKMIEEVIGNKPPEEISEEVLKPGFDDLPDAAQDILNKTIKRTQKPPRIEKK